MLKLKTSSQMSTELSFINSSRFRSLSFYFTSDLIINRYVISASVKLNLDCIRTVYPCAHECTYIVQRRSCLNFIKRHSNGHARSWQRS